MVRSAPSGARCFLTFWIPIRGSGGDDRYRFGVPVDASDDPVKDSRGTCLGIA